MTSGPWAGARMSKVRITRSTPAAAMIVGRYLFQSCVRASEGGYCWRELGWEEWRGMVNVKWFDAEEGVRRSKSRSCESEDTAERVNESWGEKAAEYVQLCIGRVTIEKSRAGVHCWVRS